MKRPCDEDATDAESSALLLSSCASSAGCLSTQRSDATAAFLAAYPLIGAQTPPIIFQVVSLATQGLNAQWGLPSCFILKYAGAEQTDGTLHFDWKYACGSDEMKQRLNVSLKWFAFKWQMLRGMDMSEHVQTCEQYLATLLVRMIVVQVCNMRLSTGIRYIDFKYTQLDANTFSRYRLRSGVLKDIDEIKYSDLLFEWHDDCAPDVILQMVTKAVKQLEKKWAVQDCMCLDYAGVLAHGGEEMELRAPSYPCEVLVFNLTVLLHGQRHHDKYEISFGALACHFIEQRKKSEQEQEGMHWAFVQKEYPRAHTMDMIKAIHPHGARIDRQRLFTDVCEGVAEKFAQGVHVNAKLILEGKHNIRNKVVAAAEKSAKEFTASSHAPWTCRLMGQRSEDGELIVSWHKWRTGCSHGRDDFVKTPLEFEWRLSLPRKSAVTCPSICQVRNAIDRGIPIPKKLAYGATISRKLESLLQASSSEARRQGPKQIEFSIMLLGQPRELPHPISEDTEATIGSAIALDEDGIMVEYLLCAPTRGRFWLCASAQAWDNAHKGELPDLLVERSIPQNPTVYTRSDVAILAAEQAEETNAIFAVAAWRAEICRAVRGDGLCYCRTEVATARFEDSIWHWTSPGKPSEARVWVCWSVLSRGGLASGASYVLDCQLIRKVLERKYFSVPERLLATAAEKAKNAQQRASTFRSLLPPPPDRALEASLAQHRMRQDQPSNLSREEEEEGGSSEDHA